MHRKLTSFLHRIAKHNITKAYIYVYTRQGDAQVAFELFSNLFCFNTFLRFLVFSSILPLLSLRSPKNRINDQIPVKFNCRHVRTMLWSVIIPGMWTHHNNLNIE